MFVLFADERLTVMENGSLSIREVRVGDRGQYECHAENRAGKIMQTTNIEVNCKLLPVQLTRIAL